MRTKKEIMEQLEDMYRDYNAGKLTEFQLRMLQEASKIGVLADIRDCMTDFQLNHAPKIVEYLKDVSAGAQIYQENNPV